MLEALQVRLDEDGRIDWGLWCVDGRSVQAQVSAVGAGNHLPGEGDPTNPSTTRWVAAEAAPGGGAPRCTWSLTAKALR